MVATRRRGLDAVAESRENTIAYAWDAHSKLVHQLNAFFLPRLYLLDENKHILYVQRPKQTPDRSLREIERILQAGNGKEGRATG
jgi:hypothetical protein